MTVQVMIYSPAKCHVAEKPETWYWNVNRKNLSGFLSLHSSLSSWNKPFSVSESVSIPKTDLLPSKNINSGEDNICIIMADQ